MGLTSAPLAPVLKMVVLDVARNDTPHGNWRLRVLNGLCTRVQWAQGHDSNL